MKPIKSRLGGAATNVAACAGALGIKSAASLAAAYGRSVVEKSRSERHVYVSSIRRTVCLRAADMGTFSEIFIKQHYAFDLLQAHAAAVQEHARRTSNKLIIDCGANIGLSVLWFHHLFSEAAIYAIEPVAANIAILEKNVIGLPNVHILSGAVWNERATMAVEYDEHNPPAARLTRTGPPFVRCYPISEIIEMAGGADPLIVKIDIEGAEAEMFSSNTEWVSRTGLIIIEPHDWMLPFQRTSVSLWSCMIRECFDVIPLNDNLFCFNHRLISHHT